MIIASASSTGGAEYLTPSPYKCLLVKGIVGPEIFRWIAALPDFNRYTSRGHQLNSRSKWQPITYCTYFQFFREAEWKVGRYMDFLFVT